MTHDLVVKIIYFDHIILIDAPFGGRGEGYWTPTHQLYTYCDQKTMFRRTIEKKESDVLYKLCLSGKDNDMNILLKEKRKQKSQNLITLMKDYH